MLNTGVELSSEQASAVAHKDGPLLILAGAGSGKTRVITQRVAQLIESGVPASSILAITFTNKAAGEMRERILGLVGRQPIWVHTFHAFAVRLLRHETEHAGLGKNFTIYDQDDRMALIKLAMKQKNIDRQRWSPGALGDAISRLKTKLTTPQEYAIQAEGFFEVAVLEVYRRYQNLITQANAVDFDDLLMLAVKLFREHEEVRVRWANRLRYILVDEYQDTNVPQFEMVWSLVKDHKNLCVSGDPDQSIYSWRGADIKNILDFEERFPGAHVVKLERNYRSTKMILKAASSLISHNVYRKEKTLFTDNPTGDPVRVVICAEDRSEAIAVAQVIRDGVAKGRSYSDHAIFFRTNALSRAVESVLVEGSIPYVLVGGVEFYRRREVKDILAYLRVLANPADAVSLERIINVPRRGIGKKRVEALRRFAIGNDIPLFEALKHCDHIEELKEAGKKPLRALWKIFAELLEWPQTPIGPLVERVVVLTGYEDFLRDSEGPLAVERIENVRELINAAYAFDRLHGETSHLFTFLEDVSLKTDLDRWDTEKDKVTLMTLHAAKGLEFPVVFILGWEENLLPHARSLELDEDIEEERRLAHVGITRAREELFLSRAECRMVMGEPRFNPRSRFLTEIHSDAYVLDDRRPGYARKRVTRSTAPEDYVDSTDPVDQYDQENSASDGSEGFFAEGSAAAPTLPSLEPGDQVLHPFFGQGEILELRGAGREARVMVRFANGDERRFVLEYAKLVRCPRPGDEG